MSGEQESWVKVRQVEKSFGEVRVLAGISFDVPRGKVVTLLGPSGCGKTTLLRCIAGLESIDGGVITIGDRVVADGAKGLSVPPERRNIGMVFQSYAVWPHMSVFENVAFPLRLRRLPRAEIARAVGEVLDLVGLRGFENRPATALSGGQQQRVALARALVGRPQLVLFDEPLSNLDANLREKVRVELAILQKRLGFTALYVTHDREEALAISDLVVILRGGVIQQVGSPEEVYANPVNPFVAQFLGATNCLKGRVVQASGDGWVVVQAHGALVRCNGQQVRPGAEVSVYFRPGDVRLQPGIGPGDSHPRNGTPWNAVPVRVEGRQFVGESWEYAVSCGDTVLRAVSRERSLAPGCEAILEFPASACWCWEEP